LILRKLLFAVMVLFTPYNKGW